MPTAQPGEQAPRKGSSSGTSSSLRGAVTHHGIRPPPGTVALTPLLSMGMMPPACLGAVWGGMEVLSSSAGGLVRPLHLPEPQFTHMLCGDRPVASGLPLRHPFARGEGLGDREMSPSPGPK